MQVALIVLYEPTCLLESSPVTARLFIMGESSKYKDDLYRNFLEELIIKLWATKGLRFHANKRLLEISDLSNNTLSYLSGYLIIFGLLSVYQIDQITGQSFISEKTIAFWSIVISILMLVFTQSEAAKEYKVKAHQFHECALKIAELYNEVKIFKTLGAHTQEETISFCKDVSSRYQQVLDKYPNHEEYDFRIFRANNQEYYKLSDLSVFTIRIKYYIDTKFIYHFFMYGPPVVFAFVYWDAFKKS